MTFFTFSRKVVGAIALAMLCTCGTLDRFDVPTTAYANIPKQTIVDVVIDQLAFDEFDELDFSQEIANQGVTEDQIDSVHMTSFVIHTDEGSGATLDFLESVAFYAEADGQARVLVASSTNFKGKTSVDLVVDEEVELKPYVVAPSMNLVAEVKGKRPAQDTRLTADVVLSVDATIPGCE